MEQGTVIGVSVTAGVVLVVAATVLCLIVVRKRYNAYTETHSPADARSYNSLFSLYAFLFVRGDKTGNKTGNTPDSIPQFLYTAPDGDASSGPSVRDTTPSGLSNVEQGQGSDVSNEPSQCVMGNEKATLRRLQSPIRLSADTYSEIDLNSCVLDSK